MVASDPHDDQTLYAFGEGVFKSSDGGYTVWRLDSFKYGGTSSLLVDVTDSEIVYLGVCDNPGNNGIYKSVNSGDSWTQINEGLVSSDVRDMMMHPTNANIIYAATMGGGVSKTINAGTSWSSVNSGLTNWNIDSLAMDLTSPEVLYAGTVNGTGSLFKTVDGGETWSLANNGIPPDTNVQDIAIDPNTPSTLYAATDKYGVFQSRDGGASWAYASIASIPDTNITAVAVKDNRMFAGSRANGLFVGVIE